mmetsp:Transcript_99503/g.145472  ORF Transcript_99503/g.145472 Transcript_99503/m.145472 type:complete len:88 (-) Transcript_99503:78-341(-)
MPPSLLNMASVVKSSSSPSIKSTSFLSPLFRTVIFVSFHEVIGISSLSFRQVIFLSFSSTKSSSLSHFFHHVIFPSFSPSLLSQFFL